MAAEQNRLARFKAKVDELGTVREGSPPDLKVGYRLMAAETGLSYDYVYQVYNGKSGKKGVGKAAVAKFESAFGEGRAPGWMDEPIGSDTAGPGDHEFEPMRPPTLAEAVEALAMAITSLDPLGRELASTVLSSLAKSPEQASRLLPTLEQLVRSHSLPPQLPPTPPRRVGAKATPTKTAAKGAAAKAHLVLKIGGGNKQQFDLPLSRSAFRTESAPPNEREWYEKLRVTPKASDDETSK